MPKRILSLKSTGGPQSITSITCGVSSPKLGGEIYLNSFPNLTSFTCANNNITGLYGTSNLSSLKTLTINNNRITTGFPDLSASVNIENINCNGESSSVRQLNGPFPDLSRYTKLKIYQSMFCGLSGNLPSLSSNTALDFFNCSFCNLSGNIPDLPASITYFTCRNNSFTGFGSNLSELPKLDVFICRTNLFSGNIPTLPISIRDFICSDNNFTGLIPSLNSCVKLEQFDCSTNQLSGNIPDLSANSKLRRFICSNTQLSGFAGSTVSNTLGDFQAQTCNLTQIAVDSILATFVAAGRTSGNANTITPGFTTCSINLAGAGNASPTSGQNNPNRLILVNQRGWQVTVN